jgi:O-antigen/teichoic acid export membrane protein
VAHFLDIEKVGVATLFFSFANTMMTLVQSGVSVFAYPKLVMYHNQENTEAFNREATRTVAQVAAGGCVVAALLGALVSVYAFYLGKQTIIAELYTFFLLASGTLLRVNAESPYLILFARHEDRPIWVGNLCFIIPALGFNILLVPVCGLTGIGYSAVISGLFLLIWRWSHVFCSRYPSVFVHTKGSSPSDRR